MREIEIKILESETRPPTILNVHGQESMVMQWCKMLQLINDKYLNAEIEIYVKDGCLCIESVSDREKEPHG